MCIYCGTSNYRKIYEQHYGSIPREDSGRSYEIHHIDGDHNNNDPNNLKAVTILEHYTIHYSQEDWAACRRIGNRMKLSPEKISELSRLNAKKHIENGTHPFINSELQSKNQRKRVKMGTHNFLGSSNNKKLLEKGLHSSQNESFRERMESFRERMKVLQKEYNRIRVEKGEHPFQALTSYSWVCEHCGKNGKIKSNYDRHVGSRACKKEK